MPFPAPSPDHSCLITGASSGIGEEIARDLARRGHRLTLVARREDCLRALADELSSAHGVTVDVLPCDLTDAAARAGLAEAVQVPVAVLVNNAGFTTMGPVHRGDRDGEMGLVRTNVEAVVDLCTMFLAGMVQRGSGAVLNVASTAAFQPLPGQAAYAASKAFVLSYTQALQAELRGTGVTATALCPGPVETGFAHAAGISDDEASASLPRFMWVDKQEVARQAVAAMEKGYGVVIPGLPNRVLAHTAWLTPRALLLPILARQHPALRD